MWKHMFESSFSRGHTQPNSYLSRSFSMSMNLKSWAIPMNLKLWANSNQFKSVQIILNLYEFLRICWKRYGWLVKRSFKSSHHLHVWGHINEICWYFKRCQLLCSTPINLIFERYYFRKLWVSINDLGWKIQLSKQKLYLVVLTSKFRNSSFYNSFETKSTVIETIF